MQVTVTGQEKLRALAAHIRAEADKGLGRELSAALKRAAKPVQDAIQAEFTAVLPQRGGYRAVASKSVRFRTTLRANARAGSFRITTFAVGKAERRDIRRLNKGELRHPVYGRSRNTRHGRIPNPWATTRIEPNFHDRAISRSAGAVEKEMVKVLDEYAARLKG
jgi:hypothetical protein